MIMTTTRQKPINPAAAAGTQPDKLCVPVKNVIDRQNLPSKEKKYCGCLADRSIPFLLNSNTKQTNDERRDAAHAPQMPYGKQVKNTAYVIRNAEQKSAL